MRRYAKQGYTASNYKANRYNNARSHIKNRVQSSIASNRPAVAVTQVIKSSGELKGMDTALGSVIGDVIATTNTNDDIAVLNLVQQGNGSWNRVGKQIEMDSLRITGAIRLKTDSETQGYANSFRMVVIYDKQPSGQAIPTWDTIFGKTNQNGTESCTIFDPLRYDNMGRFKVLLDRKIDMNPGIVGQTYMIKTIDEYIKLRNKKTIFSGQSTPMTIADISTGALYIGFRAYFDSVRAQVDVTADFMSRLRYRD